MACVFDAIPQNPKPKTQNPLRLPGDAMMDLKPLRKTIGSALGLGFLPLMPGTWGSLGAAAAGWWIVATWGAWWLLPPIVAATLLGLWAARSCVRDFGKPDPGAFVLDEVAGQWVALLGLAAYSDIDWRHILAAFALFRLFDILKPPPVRRLDRIPLAAFVILDDLAAGALAAVAMALWGVLGA